MVLEGPIDISKSAELLAREAAEKRAAKVAALAKITEGHPVRGKADAPVTVIEFSDYECPFCRRGYETVEQLLAKYPDATGDRVAEAASILRVYVLATVATDSRDAMAQARSSELQRLDATLRPLTARLADWVSALGVDELAPHSAAVESRISACRPSKDQVMPGKSARSRGRVSSWRASITRRTSSLMAPVSVT